MDLNKTRFVLIGGFLGAGKTTLIAELAKRYQAAGKSVAIITNDQAAGLVDTANLRSRGFQVGEVAGACFCCSFDELVSRANELSADAIPDVILAEPVGSCTDLVATVVMPLQQILGDRFELAPFGVLLKPAHGQRILSFGDQTPSGFSPQAEYIFNKQLEEADYVMIGRRDLLSEEQIETLRNAIHERVPGVPVIAVSAVNGEGVDEALGYIESPMVAGRRLLDIDYDTYADGEAELGWVNLTAQISNSGPAIDLDDLVQTITSKIANELIQTSQGEIAHLKTSGMADQTHAVANVVSNHSGIEIGLRAGRTVQGPIELIVNARVAMDPDALESCCQKHVEAECETRGLHVDSLSARSLRPGRPTPTHRFTAT